MTMANEDTTEHTHLFKISTSRAKQLHQWCNWHRTWFVGVSQLLTLLIHYTHLDVATEAKFYPNFVSLLSVWLTYPRQKRFNSHLSSVTSGYSHSLYCHPPMGMVSQRVRYLLQIELGRTIWRHWLESSSPAKFAIFTCKINKTWYYYQDSLLRL